jgi:hypothetical protein
MSNLHPLIADLKQSMDALIIDHPELADDPILRADMLTAETRLEDVVAMLDEEIMLRESRAEGIRATIARLVEPLKQQVSRLEIGAGAARAQLQTLMERANLTRLKTPIATLTIAYRKAIPVIEDESLLPDECCKLVKTPDKKIIKQWVDAGNVPSGVSIGNGSSVLTIKRT